jgi:hypothetical protein
MDFGSTHRVTVCDTSYPFSLRLRCKDTWGGDTSLRSPCSFRVWEEREDRDGQGGMVCDGPRLRRLCGAQRRFYTLHGVRQLDAFRERDFTCKLSLGVCKHGRFQS